MIFIKSSVLEAEGQIAFPFIGLSQPCPSKTPTVDKHCLQSALINILYA
jgi:hypothetical protein